MAKDVEDRICWRTGCRVRATHRATSGAYYCDGHRLFDWSDERVALLKVLNDEGLSRAEIAKRFGVTRNVIMGKLNRVGLVGNGAGRGNSRRREQAQINNRQRAPNPGVVAALAMARNPGNVAPMMPKAPQAAPKTAGPTPKSLNLRIIDDGFGGCRWPTVEGADGIQRFCCVTTDGQTYCEVHRRRAFQAIPATGRKSASELARSLRRYS